MTNFSQDLLILTSPPASGKTYWIESFSESLSEEILVISPLRALADECREKWPAHLQIMTPEEWSRIKPRTKVVIFDEYHLHHYWGDSFRPLMWKVFYDLCYETELVVLLTATLSNEIKTELKKYGTHFDQILWYDSGNLKLKFNPKKYIKVPDRKFIEEMVFHLPKSQGVDLIFCEYREDVFQMSLKLQKKGFVVWDCVGGEARKIKTLMSSGIIPDYIVATTVLSHGVNLPEISKVYFLYALGNQDFWIQMVARGGRRGKSYQVISLEKPYGIKFSKWNNFLAIQWISLKMAWYSIPRQISQCFLKA